VIGTASVNSTAVKRLMLLEAKFKMYLMLNEEKEFFVQKINPHRYMLWFACVHVCVK
jgi:hypothetical protein